MEALNFNLKKFRNQLGWTQEEAAEKLKVKRTTYAYWEKGTIPKESDVINICKIFKIDYKKLIDPTEFNGIVATKSSLAMEEAFIKYGKKDAVISDSISFLTHTMIKIAATQRVMLRAQAEILAAQRNESVTKTLTELSGAVEGEIAKALGELQRDNG